jgi:DnaK suppressor protein
MSEDFDFSSYVPSDEEDFMNAKQRPISGRS